MTFTLSPTPPLQDMFLVHGASIEQLKEVCKALVECEGFNSEGWVKSRVSNKKRATIDLYLKQVSRKSNDMESLLMPEDEAAGVFLQHMTQYNEMEQKLRMYPFCVCVGWEGEGVWRHEGVWQWRVVRCVCRP